MKRLICIYSLVLGVVLSSCASKNYIDQAALSELVAKDSFTFMAQRANPMDYTAVNRVTSSIPGAIPTRVLELDYGYTLELKKDSLSVNLPYFGRAYTSSYGTADTGFKFESKDFTIKKSDGKKGGYIYMISVADKPNIQRIIIDISSNGKAMLSVDANDRQPITYDGYIMKNEKE